MRLYFPVDLTGNLIMIEKLVFGEIWTGDLPIFNPDVPTSAPSWQAILSNFPVDLTGNLIMIEKLVFGEIWTGDLPIFNPDVPTSALSWTWYYLRLDFVLDRWGTSMAFDILADFQRTSGAPSAAFLFIFSLRQMCYIKTEYRRNHMLCFIQTGIPPI